jgi:hypothetical protein
MNTLHDRGDAGVAATGPSHPSLTGTWINDPEDSSISFAWRRLRFRTMTARLHCLGVIRLDDLPPVGAIGFRQPSGLPVLTMALDPASVDTGHAGLDAILGGADAFDVTRHGGGVLDRRAFGIGRRASISGRGVQLDLAVRAGRVVTGTRIAVHTTDHMHNQHAHDRRAELALQP